MNFGPLNIAGAVIVLLMLLPNIIFASRFRNAGNQCNHKAMLVLEQIGRYASIVLMVIPLAVGEFGFRSGTAFLIYALGNVLLLLAYLIIGIAYIKNQSPKKALTLAVIPACIFLLNGITLAHWLLIVTAVAFGVGHIYVTHQNNKS